VGTKSESSLLILVNCNWTDRFEYACTAVHCHSGWSSGCVNMHALTSDCTILEQRAVIKFLWAEGVKPTDIHW